eukprot:2772838-Prymnesium_polylepis.2
MSNSTVLPHILPQCTPIFGSLDTRQSYSGPPSSTMAADKASMAKGSARPPSRRGRAPAAASTPRFSMVRPHTSAWPVDQLQ